MHENGTSERDTTDRSQQDRDETEAERADRNWIELLQELRVSQTGVQLLAGFLVTLPFQQGFEDLDSFQRWWYLGLLFVAVLTVGITLAPVAMHRRLFQGRAKPELVRAGHRLTQLALTLIPVLLTGIVFLVVDVVVDRTLAAWCAVGTAAVMLVLLLVLPRITAARIAGNRPEAT
jgi:multisubunit Na+/H+ antiporter MnhE subunit